MLSLQTVAIMERELALVWNDGEESYLELETLRRSCPCASCCGEPDAVGRVVKPLLQYEAKSFVLRRAELVGGYALQLFWDDGHQTGLYSFSLLRHLSSFS